MLQRTILILCASNLLAQAGTHGFLVPSFRGLPSSEAGYWETFTVPAGPPGNLADKGGTAAAAVLTQSDTNAFLTGSGNIYNQRAVSQFSLTHTSADTLGTAVMQARTLGGEIELASVKLTYSSASGLRSLEPVSRVELNRSSQPGLGATVSSLWQWDLAGLGVTRYTISFRAAGPSLSLDSLTLDTDRRYVPLFTAPFDVHDAAPLIERWMYANNASPCDRPASSSFGTFTNTVDTRHAQHMIGWDTTSFVPANRNPGRYWVRRCRLTLTINRGGLFAYDPTHDSFTTYLPTDHPEFQPDADLGRPVELFGVGYRNGYDAGTFSQCSPFGSNSPAQRNAYAAGFSVNGALVDVSNNVGKTQEGFAPFEAVPFAIGQTADGAIGQFVPAGAKMTFDLNLSDPRVLEYVQAALNKGQLRLMISSLHVTAGQTGAPSYPDFATRFNAAVLEPTQLELDGVVIGDGDLDQDGLLDDWEVASFNSLMHAGSADPDGDGASNLAEFHAGTSGYSQSSTFKVFLTRDPDGRTTLRFPVAASRRYAIEFTENLTQWQRLSDVPLLYLDSATAHWTDGESLSGGRPWRMYRVLVQDR